MLGTNNIKLTGDRKLNIHVNLQLCSHNLPLDKRTSPYFDTENIKRNFEQTIIPVDSQDYSENCGPHLKSKCDCERVTNRCECCNSKVNFKSVSIEHTNIDCINSSCNNNMRVGEIENLRSDLKQAFYNYASQDHWQQVSSDDSVRATSNRAPDFRLSTRNSASFRFNYNRRNKLNNQPQYLPRQYINDRSLEQKRYTEARSIEIGEQHKHSQQQPQRQFYGQQPISHRQLKANNNYIRQPYNSHYSIKSTTKTCSNLEDQVGTYQNSSSKNNIGIGRDVAESSNNSSIISNRNKNRGKYRKRHLFALHVPITTSTATATATTISSSSSLSSTSTLTTTTTTTAIASMKQQKQQLEHRENQQTLNAASMSKKTYSNSLKDTRNDNDNEPKGEACMKVTKERYQDRNGRGGEPRTQRPASSQQSTSGFNRATAIRRPIASGNKQSPSSWRQKSASNLRLPAVAAVATIQPSYNQAAYQTGKYHLEPGDSIHPLEMADHKTRLSISIYDPLPNEANSSDWPPSKLAYSNADGAKCISMLTIEANGKQSKPVQIDWSWSREALIEAVKEEMASLAGSSNEDEHEAAESKAKRLKNEAEALVAACEASLAQVGALSEPQTLVEVHEETSEIVNREISTDTGKEIGAEFEAVDFARMSALPAPGNVGGSCCKLAASKVCGQAGECTSYQASDARRLTLKTGARQASSPPPPLLSGSAFGNKETAGPPALGGQTRGCESKKRPAQRASPNETDAKATEAATLTSRPASMGVANITSRCWRQNGDAAWSLSGKRVIFAGNTSASGKLDEPKMAQLDREKGTDCVVFAPASLADDCSQMQQDPIKQHLESKMHRLATENAQHSRIKRSSSGTHKQVANGPQNSGPQTRQFECFERQEIGGELSQSKVKGASTRTNAVDAHFELASNNFKLEGRMEELQAPLEKPIERHQSDCLRCRPESSARIAGQPTASHCLAQQACPASQASLVGRLCHRPANTETSSSSPPPPTAANQVGGGQFEAASKTQVAKRTGNSNMQPNVINSLPTQASESVAAKMASFRPASARAAVPVLSKAPVSVSNSTSVSASVSVPALSTTEPADSVAAQTVAVAPDSAQGDDAKQASGQQREQTGRLQAQDRSVSRQLQQDCACCRPPIGKAQERLTESMRDNADDDDQSACNASQALTSKPSDCSDSGLDHHHHHHHHHQSYAYDDDQDQKSSSYNSNCNNNCICNCNNDEEENAATIKCITNCQTNEGSSQTALLLSQQQQRQQVNSSSGNSNYCNTDRRSGSSVSSNASKLSERNRNNSDISVSLTQKQKQRQSRSSLPASFASVMAQSSRDSIVFDKIYNNSNDNHNIDDVLHQQAPNFNPLGQKTLVANNYLTHFTNQDHNNNQNSNSNNNNNNNYNTSSAPATPATTTTTTNDTTSNSDNSYQLTDYLSHSKNFTSCSKQSSGDKIRTSSSKVAADSPKSQGNIGDSKKNDKLNSNINLNIISNVNTKVKLQSDKYRPAMGEKFDPRNSAAASAPNSIPTKANSDSDSLVSRQKDASKMVISTQLGHKQVSDTSTSIILDGANLISSEQNEQQQSQQIVITDETNDKSPVNNVAKVSNHEDFNGNNLETTSTEANPKQQSKEDCSDKGLDDNVSSMEALQVQTPSDVQSNIAQQPQEQQQHNQEIRQVPSKPPPANNRSILILRDIEPDSPEESVRDIFNSENCPSKPVHCEYALRNSWYVTFKNDEDAKQALAFIRNYNLKWKGQLIMARYKTKPATPSTSNQPPAHIVQPLVIQGTSTQDNNGLSPATNGTASMVGCSPGLVISASDGSMMNGTNVGPVATNVAGATQSATGNLLPYHQPSQQMMHIGHMMPHHHHHHHHAHHQHQMSAPHHYGYSAVGHYSQHGPILTPWNYYNTPPYDLSEVFILNGLTPYPQTSLSTLNNSKMSNSGSGSGNNVPAGGGGISGAALLGGEMTAYSSHMPHSFQQHHSNASTHHNHHQINNHHHHHHQNHYLNNHQHHHNHHNQHHHNNHHHNQQQQQQQQQQHIGTNTKNSINNVGNLMNHILNTSGPNSNKGPGNQRNSHNFNNGASANNNNKCNQQSAISFSGHSSSTSSSSLSGPSGSTSLPISNNKRNSRNMGPNRNSSSNYINSSYSTAQQANNVEQISLSKPTDSSRLPARSTNNTSSGSNNSRTSPGQQQTQASLHKVESSVVTNVKTNGIQTTSTINGCNTKPTPTTTASLNATDVNSS